MEMNNRDEMEVNLEILRKENQEIKLLLEQERTLRNKLEIEGAKKKEATLKAYTQHAAEIIKHHVKVKAQKIVHNVLRVNNEDLNMKYGMLQRTHKKVEAEMAALRKANQELKQEKLRCVEEKDAEIAALHERNHELEQQKERCVEEKDAEIVVLHERNHELEQQKERCVEEEDAEIVVLHERNHELEQQKERCVEEKDAEMVVLHERNHELEQQKERCVEEKDAEIVLCTRETTSWNNRRNVVLRRRMQR
ncbi:hypothetical protein CesoFtcFv8_023854 [Champsocephalus esox]|uniref:Uncharacterized protein n=1 Tax=Champsocephalus esox TaxID=159716 RepID=A0AAN8GDS8_9TELE|nr:hypothetical protein CesoFtcFv8_023854 [Champsocephalus esox]